mmetsp:Transcript_20434/g.45851  ORF Transcript_20434/g.45851 Transcript_20434/m.45851 type:complete len:291 (-) Transcript_20434:1225-2097(-)
MCSATKLPKLRWASAAASCKRPSQGLRRLVMANFMRCPRCTSAFNLSMFPCNSVISVAPAHSSESGLSCVVTTFVRPLCRSLLNAEICCLRSSSNAACTATSLASKASVCSLPARKWACCFSSDSSLACNLPFSVCSCCTTAALVLPSASALLASCSRVRSRLLDVAADIVPSLNASICSCKRVFSAVALLRLLLKASISTACRPSRDIRSPWWSSASFFTCSCSSLQPCCSFCKSIVCKSSCVCSSCALRYAFPDSASADLATSICSASLDFRTSLSARSSWSSLSSFA